MPERLDTVSVDLSKRIRKPPAESARRVAVTAARLAIDQSGLRDSSLLDLPGHQNEVRRKSFTGLAHQLDEAAWEIEETKGSDSPAFLTLFHQARAASSAASALENDPHAAASDAIYEAHASGVDVEALIAIVSKDS